MIGNTDFRVRRLHNVELLQMANGDYRADRVRLRFLGRGERALRHRRSAASAIRTVRDRLYRGYCVPTSTYPKVFTLFNAKKDSIYALYQGPDRQAAAPTIVDETLKYFDDFYKTINNPKSAKNDIMDACVGKI